MAARDRPPDAACLEFLTPGLLHGLNNALFKLEGRAALHAPSRRQLQASVPPMRVARDLLQLAALLAGSDPGCEVPPGRLVPALCSALRVPLQDLGLRLRLVGPVRVAASTQASLLLRSLVSSLRLLAAHLPGGARITCALELGTEGQDRTRLRLRLERRPGFLPFHVPAEGLARELASSLPSVIVRAQDADTLELVLPARAG